MGSEMCIRDSLQGLGRSSRKGIAAAQLQSGRRRRDELPGIGLQTPCRTERDWFAPSVDLTVHLNDLPTGPWILNHNRAHFANDGYASAEVALSDPHAPDGPTLLVWATQVMFFTQLK